MLGGRRKLIAVVLVLTVVSAGAQLLVPTLFGRAIAAVQAEDEGRVVQFGLAILAAGALVAVVAGLLKLMSGRLAIDVEVGLRNQLYRHYLDLGGDFHSRESVGELVSRLMVSSGPIRQFLAFALPKIVNDLLTVVIAGVLVWTTSPELALAVFWPIPIAICLVAREGVRLTPLVRRRQEIEAEATGVAEDALRGIEELADLGAAAQEEAAFDAAVGEWLDIADQSGRISARYDAALESVPFLAWPCLFLLGGWQVIDGSIELHQFVTMTGYVALILAPITALTGQLWTTQKAAASAQRVFEVLDQPGAVVEGATPLTGVRGDIDIRRVTTSFDGRSKALDAIELAIDSHRNVVVVGPTGSGKSVLLDLVARTHDPQAGAIQIDGRPIDAVDLRSLRRHVRRVDSSPHLFPMTVRENLTYGAPDTTDERLVEVTRELGLHGEVMALADGYDTRVGDAAGLALPTELAQWISIARAFVPAPDIALLDDITASLPPSIERAVVAGLRELTATTTVVAVANRPALLSLADVVVVLDAGRLSAVGPFDELRETSPVLAELLRSWQLAGGDGSDGAPAGVHRSEP